MTLAIGWRDGEHVFIAADSLVTFTGSGPPPAMRQEYTFEAGCREVHQEVGCKVMQLSSNVIASWAGKSEPAFGALQQIRRWLRAGRSLRDVVRTIREKKDSPWGYRLLLGGGPPDDPQLYVVNADASCEEIYEDREPAVLGSLPDRVKGDVRNLLHMAYSLMRTEDPDVLLAAVLMSLQAFATKFDLRQYGCGGAFFGRRCSDGIVYAQPDILYVGVALRELQPDVDNEAGIAFVGLRGDGLFAWRLNQNRAVYVAPIDVDSIPEIKRAVEAGPDPLGADPPFICVYEARLGGFIGLDYRGTSLRRYLEVERSPNRFNVTFLEPLRPSLKSLLQQSPETMPAHFIGERDEVAT